MYPRSSPSASLPGHPPPLPESLPGQSSSPGTQPPAPALRFLPSPLLRLSASPLARSASATGRSSASAHRPDGPHDLHPGAQLRPLLPAGSAPTSRRSAVAAPPDGPPDLRPGAQLRPVLPSGPSSLVGVPASGQPPALARRTPGQSPQPRRPAPGRRHPPYPASRGSRRRPSAHLRCAGSRRRPTRHSKSTTHRSGMFPVVGCKTQVCASSCRCCVSPWSHCQVPDEPSLSSRARCQSMNRAAGCRGGALSSLSAGRRLVIFSARRSYILNLMPDSVGIKLVKLNFTYLSV